MAPADPEARRFPEGPTGFAPMPLARLPFASILVASTNDPYVARDRARVFAEAWGSELVEVGHAGHLDSASGLGAWPEGRALLARLVNRPERG